jgi:hypothetical protein
MFTSPVVIGILIYLVAGSYSWAISNLFLRLLRGDMRDYAKDKLGKLVWDWLVFAPILTALFVVFSLDATITVGLSKLGQDSYHLYTGILQHKYTLPLLVGFALVLSEIVASGYVRRGKPKWLAAPAGMSYARAYLVGSVLVVAATLLLLYLIDHWILFYNFLQSGWRPFVFLNTDGMYGLRWAFTSIAVETAIVALISFAPLLMYMRQTSWVYGVLSATGIVFLASYIFYLVPLYGVLGETIYAQFYSEAVTQYNTLFTGPFTDSTALAQIALAARLQLISQLPKGFSSLFVGLASAVAFYDVAAFLVKALTNQEITDFVREWTTLTPNLLKRALRSKTQKS